MSKEQATKLKKENEVLKEQIGELSQQLKDIKEKMAAFDNSSASAEKDHEKSIQYLSDEYDDFKVFKSKTEKEITTATLKLQSIEERLYRFDEIIEEMLEYSYKYNIKIIGITQEERFESSKDTVNICLKLFEAIGAKVTDQDIDIAHRVKSRNSKFPPPIVCKFTRRIARESVMENKKTLQSIDLEKINISASGKIGIFDHLTPYIQDLFYKAKMFKNQHNYAYCWTKNSVVLLKKSSESSIIKITSQDVLDKLSQETLSPQNIPPGIFPPNWRSSQQSFGIGQGLPTNTIQSTDRNEGRITRSSSQNK